ncbi:hypothetical protein H109_02424 [Trichophyton interdigitale MR816]|uniref:Uncharacterized protein n=1 Tax=Trichophyton interdigitale (strain MR816) TaxID=1215338 RepID=A0A059JD28_TRIIM|nr:hypothetical protein H101_06768 [Trichophyton interdigitale H6]KDB25750.1 hypothetical protein H109_02424 [Trichophyton interdigitale MR816]
MDLDTSVGLLRCRSRIFNGPLQNKLSESKSERISTALFHHDIFAPTGFDKSKLQAYTSAKSNGYMGTHNAQEYKYLSTTVGGSGLTNFNVATSELQHGQLLKLKNSGWDTCCKYLGNTQTNRNN